MRVIIYCSLPESVNPDADGSVVDFRVIQELACRLGISGVEEAHRPKPSAGSK